LSQFVCFCKADSSNACVLDENTDIQLSYGGSHFQLLLIAKFNENEYNKRINDEGITSIYQQINDIKKQIIVKVLVDTMHQKEVLLLFKNPQML
jgi:hypothetical protein